MAKKNELTPAAGNPRTSGVADKSANVVRFEISEEIVVYAARLGADLKAPIEDRADRAAEHMNRSQRHELATGLLLASIKAECEHGQFLGLLEERGFEERSARRAMQYAQFILSRSDDEREFLIGQPKTKVLALAGADAAVIEDLLENGDDSDLNTLSVRELRVRIRDLEKQTADIATQRDTAEAEREGLAKKLKKRVRDAEDHEGTPVVITDIRAEIAALFKKAELSLDSTYPVFVELVALGGNKLAGDWVKPSLRLALSGLVALRLQLDGLIKSSVDALGDKVDALLSQPDGLAFLDANEIKAVAEEWATLTATHGHEAEQRKYQREQAQPRGKGRPAGPPKAPKA